MDIWETYTHRMEARGGNIRNSIFKTETRNLLNKTINTLSYKKVIVDGINRDVSIINSDNLNEKMMISMPGEDFDCGGLVEWGENHWLITEKDANNELYTKVKLLQCNHLLKWVDDDDVIHEQWCVIEDGTKLRILVSA